MLTDKWKCSSVFDITEDWYNLWTNWLPLLTLFLVLDRQHYIVCVFHLCISLSTVAHVVALLWTVACLTSVHQHQHYVAQPVLPMLTACHTLSQILHLLMINLCSFSSAVFSCSINELEFKRWALQNWRMKLKLSNELELGGIYLWNDVRYKHAYFDR